MPAFLPTHKFPKNYLNDLLLSPKLNVKSPYVEVPTS